MEDTSTTSPIRAARPGGRSSSGGVMIVVLSGDDGSVMMMTRVVAVDVVNTFLLLVCWNLQAQTFNVGGARRSHYLRGCVCLFNRP